MKILTKTIRICALATLISFSAYSQQDYKMGIGVRLGGATSGLTVRGFTNNNTALEGILGIGYRNFMITGLYEKFKPITNAPGLKWFYGGGAHIGFFRYGAHYYRYYVKHGDHLYVEAEGETAAVAGIDFIIGLDYKFKDAPISIGVDLKPFFDFWDGVEGYWDGALSLRFAF